MQKHTICVHSGSVRDERTQGLNTPIYVSSSFAYLQTPENVYPRYFNTPNQKAVAAKLCALEHGEAGMVFSSGLAAISAVFLAFLNSGDHLVMQRDIYGGTHHFVTADFDRFGIEYSLVDNHPAAIDAAIRDNTKLVYIETPSNPLLLITDIAAVSELARRRKLISVIDNTFATPINQRPIDLGIDIVIHSGTKYLGGHSDLCCGAVIASSELIGHITATAVNLGGSLDAAACARLERSLKTLGLRVEKQNANAHFLAQHLREWPVIRNVHYPGLPDHPAHDTAVKQMEGFGGMLSMELDAQIDPDRFLRRLELITPALSLGGVETIVCVPATSSHAKLSAPEREALGISDGLLRLSVGIEDPSDLLADIEQALA